VEPVESRRVAVAWLDRLWAGRTLRAPGRSRIPGKHLDNGSPPIACGAETASVRRSPPLTVVLLGVAIAVAGAGCATATGRTATPTAPRHHVLLIGDSLMGNTAPLVGGPLTRAGWDVDIIDAHVNGTGVLGPVGDAPDSLTYVREQLAHHPDVDTVVIEWAGACATCGTTDPVYGSPEFITAWRTRAHEIIDYLHSLRGGNGTRLQVAWVKSPPMPGDASDTARYQLRAAVALVLSWMDETDLGPAAGPAKIDWFAALADTDEHYRESLIYDGSTHQVRADDRVHLTADGAARTAQWTAVALSRLWSAPARRESGAS